MNKLIVGFAAAVGVQLLILAAVPARKIIPRLIGQTVVLRVAPVDPYSIMSGYYVVLNYEISRPVSSQAWRSYPEGATLYVVLAPADDGTWRALSVHGERPQSAPPKSVIIKGRKGSSGVEYGIESFYIPEDVRDEIEDDLRKNAGEALVDIKVDRFGNAALLRLRIQDRTYEY